MQRTNKKKQLKVNKATKLTNHVPPKSPNQHQAKAETNRHPENSSKEHCPMSLAVLRRLEANNLITVAKELKAQM